MDLRNVLWNTSHCCAFLFVGILYSEDRNKYITSQKYLPTKPPFRQPSVKYFRLYSALTVNIKRTKSHIRGPLYFKTLVDI